MSKNIYVPQAPHCPSLNGIQLSRAVPRRRLQFVSDVLVYACLKVLGHLEVADPASATVLAVFSAEVTRLKIDDR